MPDLQLLQFGHLVEGALVDVTDGVPRQLQLLHMAQAVAEGVLVQFRQLIEGEIQSLQFREVPKVVGGYQGYGIFAYISVDY